MENENKKKSKNTFWDIVILIGFVSVIVGVFLDSAGVNNNLIQVLIYFGIGLAGAGVSYRISGILKGVDMISKDIRKLSNSFENLEVYFKELGKK